MRVFADVVQDFAAVLANRIRDVMRGVAQVMGTLAQRVLDFLHVRDVKVVQMM